MLRVALVALMIALPGVAGAKERTLCVPENPAPIPQVLAKSYADARKELLDAGWKPYQFGPGDDDPRLRWAVEAGYTELETCRMSGPVPCHFNLSDPNGNVLHLMTFGDEAWYVVQYFFLCEGDNIAPGYVYTP